MLYLICYDIKNTRTRTKVAKILEQNGLDRLQFSVFVGVLSITRKRSLTSQLDKLLNEQQDATVSIIALRTFESRNCIQLGDKPVDWAYYENKKITLII